MSLSSILELIKEQKQIADQDLYSIDPRALPYKKGQINSAKSKLEGLYIDYKNEVLKNSVFILVTGNESEKFASIAEESFKCFSVESKVMFREILDQISPHLYKDKKINASVFEAVGNVLEDKMKMLDVTSYNQLIFDTRYSTVVKNEEEMLNIITAAICNIVGSEVVGIDALERVSQRAVNKNYKSKIVPILLHSIDEDFIDEFVEGIRKINPRIIKIIAGKVTSSVTAKIALDEVTEKTVEEALKTIATNAQGEKA